MKIILSGPFKSGKSTLARLLLRNTTYGRLAATKDTVKHLATFDEDVTILIDNAPMTKALAQAIEAAKCSVIVTTTDPCRWIVALPVFYLSTLQNVLSEADVLYEPHVR